MYLTEHIYLISFANLEINCLALLQNMEFKKKNTIVYYFFNDANPNPKAPRKIRLNFMNTGTVAGKTPAAVAPPADIATNRTLSTFAHKG